MRLSPVNSLGLAILQRLQEGDSGNGGHGVGGGSESGGAGAREGQSWLVLEVEELVEREEVCPSGFVSDAECWCEEDTEKVHEAVKKQDEAVIPETPSPVKRVVHAPRVSSASDTHWQPHTQTHTHTHTQSQIEQRVVPSFPTVLHDLDDQKALLLVSIRSISTRASPSSAPSSAAADAPSKKVKRALLSGIAPNGRVGFVQFVNDAEHIRTAERGAPSEAAVCNNVTLPCFASHMMEEWAWRPCERLLELGKQLALPTVAGNIYGKEPWIYVKETCNMQTRPVNLRHAKCCCCRKRLVSGAALALVLCPFIWMYSVFCFVFILFDVIDQFCKRPFIIVHTLCITVVLVVVVVAVVVVFVAVVTVTE